MQQFVVYRCSNCGTFVANLDNAECWCIFDQPLWVKGTWQEQEAPTDSFMLDNDGGVKKWQCTEPMVVTTIMLEDGSYPVVPPVEIFKGRWYCIRRVGDQYHVEETNAP